VGDSGAVPEMGAALTVPGGMGMGTKPQVPIQGAAMAWALTPRISTAAKPAECPKAAKRMSHSPVFIVVLTFPWAKGARKALKERAEWGEKVPRTDQNNPEPRKKSGFSDASR
jgi:hypothetical protein